MYGTFLHETNSGFFFNIDCVTYFVKLQLCSRIPFYVQTVISGVYLSFLLILTTFKNNTRHVFELNTFREEDQY